MPLAADPPITEPAPQVLVVPPLEKSASQHSWYFPALLQLALDKTAEQGPVTLEHYPKLYTNRRFLSMLQQGTEVDAIWSLSSAELEDSLLRVPVPLLKDLNSYRLLLIRADDAPRFAAIDQLDQLRNLRGGMGSQWLDTPVLQAQGLPLVTTAHYELLFTMLENARVDYLPRGVHEIWDEQALHADKGLVVEPTLMLYYPAPFYFFVHKDDRALAERIERGLRVAIADGSFDELFFSVPSFARGYAELQNAERRRLSLEPAPR